MSITPSLMRQRGIIGAHTKWALTTDRTAATAPGRLAAATALEARLIAQFGLDPDAADFGLRLEHARRAHFQRMSLASARTRRKAQAG